VKVLYKPLGGRKRAPHLGMRAYAARLAEAVANGNLGDELPDAVQTALEADYLTCVASPLVFLKI
jgi:hypothetical protein